MTDSTAFIAAIAARETRIGIVGLGYVGLPLVLAFAARGYHVIGFDIDPAKPEALKAGRSYIRHIPPAKIASMVESGRFDATTDFKRIAEVDAILICVPTPLTKTMDPDLSYIVGTAEEIGPYLRKGQLVVLESTTYPGTTTDLMQPILEKESGLKAQKDFYVAYSPEREDPGNPNFETTTIPKVVGAATAEGLAMTSALYSVLVPKVVTVSSPETAEAVKLTENIFRAVNIALVNELKLIFGPMGIDVWEVIEAAKSKPFGYMPFYPGPGLGGHCIPIDPFYLSWKAREFGMSARFIELAGEVNRDMPRHVVNELQTALGARQQKSLNGAKVLIVGIAYKKDVDDMRESPALIIYEMLLKSGTNVAYYDPHIPVIPMTREHASLAGLRSVVWSADIIAGFDAAFIVTDHSVIDWAELVTHSRLVVDTRNATKAIFGPMRDRIVKA
jgi:UDP-N-acetyl-D-glucosamine dehydrogenase